MTKSYITKLSKILGILLVLILPLLTNNQYVLHMFVMAGIYVILAMSLNLLLGFTGLFSLGHAAFYGIGAYISALLTVRWELPFIIAFLLAGILTGIVGAIFGFPALRLKGIFLAIGTLGFNEIVRLLILNGDELTGGPSGIAGIPKPSLFGFSLKSTEDFYVALIVLVIVMTVMLKRIISSRHGRALVAIRDNEMAARSVGINVTRYKVIAFALSSALAGFAGSFFAHYMSYISPDNFGLHESFAILAMVALGGMGNLYGSIFGAVLLVIIPESFRFLQDYRNIIYGVTIILIMFVLPNGILGWYPGLRDRVLKREGRENYGTGRS